MNNVTSGVNLGTIVVDLTPVLPGGENGGAKIYILALLQELAERAPSTQFIILTQQLAHEELCAYTNGIANIRCQQVLTSASVKLSSVAKFFFRLQHIPLTRRLIRKLYHGLYTLVRKRHTRQILKDTQADLLFCPFTGTTFAKKGIPVVSVVHDLQFKTYPHFFAEADFFHRNHTIVTACKKADLLIAVSEYSRQTVLEHHKISPHKIITIHTQITAQNKETAPFHATRFTQWQLEPGAYIIYPANFWKHKNHEMLLIAFQMLVQDKNSTQPIKLVCTGAPGERQSWLMHAADKMGLGTEVIFPGFLSNEELSMLLAHSAGLIFPSLYEGFGIPIIEAMAAGIPVACSNRCALPEIAGDAALLFDPATPHAIYEALHTLVYDEGQRAALIQRGQERAKAFCRPKEMAVQYWEAFARVIGK